MNHKLLIALILNLKIEAHQPEKVVLLLDQIHEAQAYWEVMARDKKLRFWKRPTHTWLASTWKADIICHQKNLAEQRTELIEVLANLSENQKSLSYETFSKLKKRTVLTLIDHGALSHFKRRWVSYASIATAAAAIVFYLHKFKQDHVLFIIPPQNNSLASSLENLYPFSGHKYVTDQDGTQYLQVKKSEEEKAKIFLADENIIALKGSPYISLCWRNEQGENKVQEFIRKYGIQPIQKIYTILKNEDQPETKLLTTNSKRNEQLYETTLTKVLQNAMEVEQAANIMHKNLNGKAIGTLSLPEKQELFLNLTAGIGDMINTQIKEVGDLLHAEDQRIHASKQDTTLFTPLSEDGPWRRLRQEYNLVVATANDNKELVKSLGGEAQKYANVINHLTKTTPGFFGLIVQIVTTTAFELKLKEASFTHMAQSAVRDAQLNIELSKTIPLMLSMYLGYLGANTIYRHATALTIITPLKTDLVSLQLVLNKDRYTKDCVALSKNFKGECFYWIQRLHRYKDKLPVPYRATYRRYLDELESKTLLPEQKMTIITCLFQELDPLFKKE